VPQAERAMLEELVRLRHGWGLDATHLRKRIGPQLTLVFDIRETDGDREIRSKVLRAVEVLSAAFPPDDRNAIALAFGGVPGTQHRLLSERVGVLALRLHCAPRTARRRVDHAFERLADESVARLGRDLPDRTDDPEKGWYVRRIVSLLRLDSDVPELIEERTIVSTRDRLARIAIRFSVPPAGRGDPSPPATMNADVQQGARIESIDQDGEGHFRLELALPCELERGAEHTYTIKFWLSPGPLMRHHYAVVPLVDCEALSVRARFSPDDPPRIVWRLDRMAPRPLAGRPTPGDPLSLDGAYEILLEFRHLERGFGYGVAWATDEDLDIAGPPPMA
jgi:hypothetical protein